MAAAGIDAAGNARGEREKKHWNDKSAHGDFHSSEIAPPEF
jgi:hypothetical protein